MDRNEAWAQATKKQPNWKAPRPDAISAFWYKSFRSTTTLLRDQIWEMLDDGEEFPQWWVSGRTVMLPKKGCTGEPEQYRPITCLNVAYKLLTGALTAILTEHIMTLDLP